MEHLCDNVYGPLLQLCSPRKDQIPNYSHLVKARETHDCVLLTRLGPGFTTPLLLASLANDADAFFQTADENPLLQFLGGKEMYDQDTVYWDWELVTTCLRNGLMVQALSPLVEKLRHVIETCVSLRGHDRTQVIHKLMADPQVVVCLMGLLETGDDMTALMTCLRAVLEGMLTEAPPAVASPPSEVVHASRSSPGAFLKQTRQARTQRGSKSTSTLQTVMGMLKDFEPDMGDARAELASMPKEDMAQMLQSMSGLLGGQDPAQILTLLQTSTKLGDGQESAQVGL
jgi:hypothetical protein